jgi:hypothetical protein
MDRPLMPKATAVWLVDNTSLTFEQIAAFCSLHPLEVQGIADGDVGVGVRGLDPVAAGQLTREEIERCQKDSKSRLQLARPMAADVKIPKRRGPRYTPLSKRQDRPDAIAWLLRNHPELTDRQVCRLLGTTKATVNAVRDRTHWKSAEIRPRDPVFLGLCGQVDLDAAVIAARAEQKQQEAVELKAAEASMAQVEDD